MRATVGLLLLALASADSAAPGVTVRADQALCVNGYERIEGGVFGLTAYEGADWVETPEGRGYYRAWGVESVGIPVPFEWLVPKGQAPMDAAAVDAWFDREDGAPWYATRYPGPGTDRYVAGRILPALAADGVEPWAYLLNVVPGSADANGLPADFDFWARFAGRTVGLLARVEPRLRYVHVGNEPNASWFKSGMGGRDYARLFTAAARSIRERAPGVRVGGPVLCWPPTWPPSQEGQEDWYTWETWTRPVIDGCGADLAFLDWHAYDVDARTLEGEVHIVTAYARTRQGRWLRSAITETNYTLLRSAWADRPTHYRLRALPLARQTMMALRNPDKLFTRQVHDFHAWVADPGAFRWRPDADGRPTPVMELYGVLRPLRGTRLVTGRPEGGPLLEASADGSRLTVAMFNPTARPWRGALDVAGLRHRRIRAVTARVLDAVSLRPAPGVRPGAVVELPPESLTVVACELSNPIDPAQRLRRDERFARQVMAPVPPDGRMALDFRATTRGATGASVRLGFKGPAADAAWRLRVGDETHALRAPGAFAEVRLKKPPRAGPVVATLERLGPPPTGPRVHLLSFASLMLERAERRPRPAGERRSAPRREDRRGSP